MCIVYWGYAISNWNTITFLFVLIALASLAAVFETAILPLIVYLGEGNVYLGEVYLGDKDNSRSETWHWPNDEIWVVVQS